MNFSRGSTFRGVGNKPEESTADLGERKASSSSFVKIAAKYIIWYTRQAYWGTNVLFAMFFPSVMLAIVNFGFHRKWLNALVASGVFCGLIILFIFPVIMWKVSFVCKRDNSKSINRSNGKHARIERIKSAPWEN